MDDAKPVRAVPCHLNADHGTSRSHEDADGAESALRDALRPRMRSAISVLRCRACLLSGAGRARQGDVAPPANGQRRSDDEHGC